MNYSSYNNNATKNADEFSAVQGATLSSVSISKTADAFEKGKLYLIEGTLKGVFVYLKKHCKKVMQATKKIFNII